MSRFGADFQITNKESAKTEKIPEKIDTKPSANALPMKRKSWMLRSLDTSQYKIPLFV